VRVKEGKVWLEDAAREHKVVIEERRACRADRGKGLQELRDMTPAERENFGRWAEESLPAGIAAPFCRWTR